MTALKLLGGCWSSWSVPAQENNCHFWAQGLYQNFCLFYEHMYALTHTQKIKSQNEFTLIKM